MSPNPQQPDPIKDAYTLFASKGYNGTIDQFKTLIKDNEKARKDAYSLFTSKGYNGSEEDFSALMGLKKKEVTGLPSTGEKEVSLSGGKQVDTNTAELLEAEDPTGMDLIPEQTVDVPVADLYDQYKQAGAITPKQTENIEAEIERQEKGDRSWWETFGAYADGLINTGFAIPLYRFDSKEDLLEQQKAKNRVNFLEALPEEKVKELNAYAVRGVTTLDKENMNVLAENTILEEKSKQLVNDLKAQEKIIGQIKAEGGTVPAEGLKIYQETYNELQELASEYNDNVDILENNTEDIGSFAEELDFLKKNYGGLDYYKEVFRLSGAEMVGGIREFGTQMIKSSGPYNTTELELENKQYREELERQRDLIKPTISVTDIEDAGSFGKWLAEQTAQQLPTIIALAGGGTPGLTALGMSSAGSKMGQMQDQGNYTQAEVLLAGLATGASEVLTERVSLGILSKGKRTIEAAVKGGSQQQVKAGIKDFVVNTTKDALSEGGAEMVNQISQNMVDIMYLGNSDVHIFDGTADAFASGTAMGAGMSAVPGMIGMGMKSFMSKEKADKIAEDSKEVAEMMETLESKKETLDDSTKELLEKEIQAKIKSIEDALQKSGEDMANLEEAQVQELIDIDKEGNNIMKQVKALQESDLGQELKDKLLKKLEDRATGLRERKSKLLENAEKTKEVRQPSEEKGNGDESSVGDLREVDGTETAPEETQTEVDPLELGKETLTKAEGKGRVLQRGDKVFIQTKDQDGNDVDVEVYSGENVDQVVNDLVVHNEGLQPAPQKPETETERVVVDGVERPNLADGTKPNKHGVYTDVKPKLQLKHPKMAWDSASIKVAQLEDGKWIASHHVQATDRGSSAPLSGKGAYNTEKEAILSRVNWLRGWLKSQRDRGDLKPAVEKEVNRIETWLNEVAYPDQATLKEIKSKERIGFAESETEPGHHDMLLKKYFGVNWGDGMSRDPRGKLVSKAIKEADNYGQAEDIIRHAVGLPPKDQGDVKTKPEEKTGKSTSTKSKQVPSQKAETVDNIKGTKFKRQAGYVFPATQVGTEYYIDDANIDPNKIYNWEYGRLIEDKETNRDVPEVRTYFSNGSVQDVVDLVGRFDALEFNPEKRGASRILDIWDQAGAPLTETIGTYDYRKLPSVRQGKENWIEGLKKMTDMDYTVDKKSGNFFDVLLDSGQIDEIYDQIVLEEFAKAVKSKDLNLIGNYLTSEPLQNAINNEQKSKGEDTSTTEKDQGATPRGTSTKKEGTDTGEPGPLQGAQDSAGPVVAKKPRKKRKMPGQQTSMDTQDRKKGLIHERIPVQIDDSLKPSGRPKKLSQIVADVAKKLKATVVYGKTDRSRAIGTYYPGSTLTKIKNAGDLDTVAHELGHALDDRFQLLKAVGNNKKIKDQLKWYYDRGGSNPPRGVDPVIRQSYLNREGLAEFIRAYVVNPPMAKKQSPELFDLFEKTLDADTLKVMQDFSKDVLDLANSPAGEQILANVEDDLKERRFRDKISDFLDNKNTPGVFKVSPWSKIKARWTNSMEVANKAFVFATELRGQSLKNLKPSQSFEVMARLFAGINGKINYMLNTSFVDPSNKQVRDSQGKIMNIKYLLEPLNDQSSKSMKEDMAEVIKYLIAQRTFEYADRFGRESNLTGIGAGLRSDIEVAMQYLKDFEALKKTDRDKYDRITEGARRYREFADAGLRYAVESGRLSPTDYQTIKNNNQFYVSLAREKEVRPGEEALSFLTEGSKLATVKDVIKTAKGGTDKIKNPYMSLLKNTVNLVKESDRNRVLTTFIEPVIQQRGMGDGVPLDLAQIARLSKQGEPQTIKIMNGGVEQYWQFDKDIYESLKAISEISKDGAIVSVMKPLANLIRNSVTTFPVFAVRNAFRDTFSRMVLSRSGARLSDLMAVAGPEAKAFELYGGSQAGFHLANEDAYKQKLKDGIRTLARKGDVILDPRKLRGRDFTKFWTRYRRALELGENINRMAEYRSAYRKAIKEGMDEYNAGLYAAYQARDLMDFAVAGTWMREINKVIPFSNAAIQSIKRSVKGAKENPAKFAMKMAMWTILPQVISRVTIAAMGAEEEYEQLPDWQRDLFWNFKTPFTGNAWITIPKPFELGMPSAWIDRGISYSRGYEDAFDGTTMSTAQVIFPVDASTLTLAFRPLAEAISNYDNFRQKEIVPYWEKDLDINLREGTKYASSIGRSLSDAFGFVGAEADPRKIDHVIKGYTTYWGTYTLSLFDTNKENSQNAFNFTKTGFARGMPVGNAKSVKKALDLAKDINADKRKEVKILRGAVKMYYHLVEADDMTQEEKQRVRQQKKEAAKRIWDYAKYLGAKLEAEKKIKVEAAKASK